MGGDDSGTAGESGAEKGAAAWDARYDALDSPFGDDPTAGLVMALAHPLVAPTLAPGDTALALADGDGRNGSWLATRGLAVTAVDLSPRARALAEARDRARGVSVRRLTADLAAWRAGTAARLVTLQFLQGPPPLRHAALAAAVAAVAPGGWLYLEGFATRETGAPAPPDGPGPTQAHHRWDPGALVEILAPLGIVEALTGPVALADGPRHLGPGHVLRLLARRR
ncbi:MAG: class I SAM-dependent methyltransferase [Pseudomonadota bacterium]